MSGGELFCSRLVARGVRVRSVVVMGFDFSNQRRAALMDRMDLSDGS